MVILMLISKKLTLNSGIIGDIKKAGFIEAISFVLRKIETTLISLHTKYSVVLFVNPL